MSIHVSLHTGKHMHKGDCKHVTCKQPWGPTEPGLFVWYIMQTFIYYHQGILNEDTTLYRKI